MSDDRIDHVGHNGRSVTMMSRGYTAQSLLPVLVKMLAAAMATPCLRRQGGQLARAALLLLGLTST